MACGIITESMVVLHDWSLGTPISEDSFANVCFLFPKGHRFPKGAALTPEQAIKDAKFWGLKYMEILRPGDKHKIIIERI